jgi:hypothetical protein
VHSKAADSNSLGITSKSMTDLLLLLALLLVHATDDVPASTTSRQTNDCMPCTRFGVGVSQDASATRQVRETQPAMDLLVGLLDGDAIKLSIREHLSCLD